MVSLLALGTIPLVIIALWLYTAWTASTFPTLTGKRILLLIAHPDDEAMFFAPTVATLTHPSLGNHVKIVCLCTGTAGGSGEVRRKELYKSGEFLGIGDKNDILIVDDPALQDSMTATWSPSLISDLLLRTFAPTIHKTPRDKAPTALIDVLLTFDSHGISSHPNHIACHHAAILFLKTIMTDRSGWKAPVNVYTLTTVPIWRKYAGVMDCLGTILAIMWAMLTGGARKVGKEKAAGHDILLFVSGWGGYLQGLRAMVQGHRSQMLWFRWGWIGLGRYMVLNDLRKVKGVY